MSEPVRVELIVFGRVQGVFYRASVQQEAQRLGLLGETGNLPDGRVEIAAEGLREAVEELIAWCRRGPPAAEVERVEVKWSTPRGEYRTFRVTR